jgi:hypothetical protein
MRFLRPLLKHLMFVRSFVRPSVRFLQSQLPWLATQWIDLNVKKLYRHPLVDINNINVPGQRMCSHFLVQIPRANAEIVTKWKCENNLDKMIYAYLTPDFRKHISRKLWYIFVVWSFSVMRFLRPYPLHPAFNEKSKNHCAQLQCISSTLYNLSQSIAWLVRGVADCRNLTDGRTDERTDGHQVFEQR